MSGRLHDNLEAAARTVARPDGSKQPAFVGCPSYIYVGNQKPGDVNGNDRHVIVYGDPQGEIPYPNAGGDPRDQARLCNTNMFPP